MHHTITLQPSGEQFVATEGETILAAARRVGLALACPCSSAESGSCIAHLISGEIRPAALEQAGQPASGQRHAPITVCKAVPATDLSMAIGGTATAASIPRRKLSVAIADKSLFTPDIVRIRLAPLDGERLERLPGQYLNVLMPEGERRAFSIANAPHEGNHIELHVRRIAGGGFTRQLFEDFAPGHRLLIEGPLGSFVPREDSNRPLLFIAGGTGFAPIQALLEHFLHRGSRRPMTLYWGARHAADLYQHTMLRRWTRRFENFRYVPVLSGPNGPVDWRQASVLQAVIQDLPALSAYDVYFSGPPTMIEACRIGAIAAGAIPERLFRDAADTTLAVAASPA
ncbi:MAG: FAD-binding oxidoreductase [Pseudomonadota bacterium]|nr:FAD-binding oxidoreductase [Pseudomonadota bacterium]